ncbi:hypothetical protein MBLNU13_g03429t1 [Cladosporium sp. NU13]
MPAPTSGRDSRRGSKASGESGPHNIERKEKAKSTQVYGQSSPQRSQQGNRITSAPIVERRRGSGYATGLQRLPPSQEYMAQAGTGAAEAGQDEDEATGVVGAMRQYEPFRSPQPEEPIPEMNIAVIGGDGVGKSTFVQKALDLPSPAPTKAADRKIPYDGTLYRIRLLEISIDDVEIDDDDTVSWPDSVGDKMMPHIDGVLTLYDVADRESIEDVPETLAALPSVLISCKCDTAPAERELDPVGVEASAKRAVKSLRAVQTSLASPETFKMGLATLVKAVVTGDTSQQGFAGTRQRAQSNAVRSVSPRAPGLPTHARANSDYTTSLYRDRGHSRHDSSLVAQTSNDHLKVPGDSEQGSNSFLLEESGGESISGSQRSSTDVESAASGLLNAQPTSALSENGATFEELVDRLLSQPTSKADGKFVVIFLALYRKFAAPGRLLEAIVERFDALERNGTPLMIKMVAQLRILSIMEQWISHYPGDFAYQKTRRRVRTFIAKISAVSIFHVAAKEMGAGLELVQEDDDTEWGYSDRNRNASDSNTYRWTMSKTASILIDDESFIFPDNMSVVTADDASFAPSLGGDTIRSQSSTTSSHLMFNFESAQRQAALINPRERMVLSKLEWRMLMGLDDGLIARELTRMDWIMFSSIRPRDLVRSVSLKPASKAACKNLVNVERMSEHFNHLAVWVSNFILLRDKPKHRALMLEKMMRVARKLRELNNYNALGAFLAGLRSTAVYRLQATRELIPPAVGKDWMKLEILMNPSRSHAAYRLAWDNSSSERIPYIPLSLRDLTTAEQGNPTFIGDEQTGRINWKKFEVMGEVIVGLQKAQGLPYRGLGNGRMGEQARELVMDVKLVKDEEELYERSTYCEPIATQGGNTTDRIRNFFRS